MTGKKAQTLTDTARKAALLYFWAAGLYAASTLLTPFRSSPHFGPTNIILTVLVSAVVAVTIAQQGRWWQAVRAGRMQTLPQLAELCRKWWLASVLASVGLLAVLPLIPGSPVKHAVEAEVAVVSALVGLALLPLIWWFPNRWLVSASAVLAGEAPSVPSGQVRWAQNVLQVLQILMMLSGILGVYQSRNPSYYDTFWHLGTAMNVLNGLSVILLSLAVGQHRQGINLIPQEPRRPGPDVPAAFLNR